MSASEPSSEDAPLPVQGDERPARGRFIAALVIAVAAAVPLLGQLAKLRVDNDVEHWLASEDESTRVLDWFLKFFPARERVYISWRSNSLSDERVGRFIEALRSRDTLFDDVADPNVILDRMVEEGVDREEAVDRLRGYLLGYEETDPRVGLLAFVLPEAGKKPRGLVKAIEEAATEVGIPVDELSLAGSIRVRAQLNAEVDHVAYNPEAPAWRLDRRSTLLSSILVALLLTVALVRKVRLSLLVLAVACSAMVLTLGVLPLTGGSLNIVLLVMPTLVFVVTLSGGLHVVNYFRLSGQQHPSAAAKKAQSTAIPPCLLASSTTAIGLASLTISPLTPVKQFGFYSAIGTGVALCLAVFVMPALLWLSMRNVPPLRSSSVRLFEALARFSIRFRMPVLVLCSIALAVSAYGLLGLKTESRIIRYFPTESAIGRGYRDIEANVSGLAPIETLVIVGEKTRDELRFRERLELIRAASQAVAGVPAVTGTVCLADFVPATPQPPASASFLQKARWYKLGSEIERRLRNGGAEAESLFWLEVDEDDEFASAGDEIWGISSHATILPDDVDFSELVATIEETARAALPADADVTVLVTGTVPQLLRVQKAVLDSLVVSFMTAFAVIAVVLAIYLRDPIASLLLMLPNLLPVVLVFGFLAWFGVPVDIGTMLTASVALGIAVDDSVHLLIGFRKRVRRGTPIEQAVSESLCHSGVALVQTTLVLSSGLLLLGSSDMRLISQFGLVMASLLCMALIADVILLPGMLAGLLGRRIAGSGHGTADSVVEHDAIDEAPEVMPVAVSSR